MAWPTLTGMWLLTRLFQVFVPSVALYHLCDLDTGVTKDTSITIVVAIAGCCLSLVRSVVTLAFICLAPDTMIRRGCCRHCGMLPLLASVTLDLALSVVLIVVAALLAKSGLMEICEENQFRGAGGVGDSTCSSLTRAILALFVIGVAHFVSIALAVYWVVAIPPTARRQPSARSVCPCTPDSSESTTEMGFVSFPRRRSKSLPANRSVEISRCV